MKLRLDTAHEVEEAGTAVEAVTVKCLFAAQAPLKVFPLEIRPGSVVAGGICYIVCYPKMRQRTVKTESNRGLGVQ